MTDRNVDFVPTEVPELDDLLEAVLLQALEIAEEKLEAGEEVVPFTALALGDKLATETHPADDPQDCFALARHTVQHARGAAAYAFCYDGYLETDDGQKDALIVEGGLPGAEAAHVIAKTYTFDEGDNEYDIEDDALYLGPTENFMEFTEAFGGGEEAEAAKEAEKAEDAEDDHHDDGKHDHDHHHGDGKHDHEHDDDGKHRHHDYDGDGEHKHHRHHHGHHHNHHHDSEDFKDSEKDDD